MKNRNLAALLVVFLASVALLNVPARAAESTANPSLTIPLAVKVGEIAKATLTDWPGAQNIAFAWLVAGKAVPTAKTPSLKILPAMNLKSLQAVETATVNGEKVSVFSNKVLIGKAFVDAKIDFAPGSKQSIRVSDLKTSPAAAKTSYQWYRDGQLLKGATASSYKLLAKDFFSTFRVSVAVQASGYVANRVLTEGFLPDDQTKTYSLLWSDEFNGLAGSAFDSSKWVAQEGDGVAFKNAGWGNNEEQWYLGSQATATGDGSLRISAKRAGATNYKCYYGACTWVSSKLVTYKKVGFMYGRFEARIKSSTGQGVWPAFWLLGANIDSRLWPGCGETDIMELKGAEPNTLWGTIHGPNGDLGTTKTLSSDISQWHTYTIDWTPDSITWFVDGVSYQRITRWDYVGASSPQVWVFDHEFYIILNLAMGGNFVGGPSDPNLSTANLDIDYVRFYSIDGVGQLIQH